MEVEVLQKEDWSYRFIKASLYIPFILTWIYCIESVSILTINLINSNVFSKLDLHQISQGYGVQKIQKILKG